MLKSSLLNMEEKNENKVSEVERISLFMGSSYLYLAIQPFT